MPEGDQDQLLIKLGELDIALHGTYKRPFPGRLHGIALKKVEQRENAKKEEANEGANQTDVASILARRVAVEMSDSDNENATDSEYDSDDWGDESTA